MNTYTEKDCQQALERLNNRQRDVLRLLAEGQARKQVAASLGIAEGTVRVYIEGCYSRLGVNGLAQAVRVAVRGGLV